MKLHARTCASSARRLRYNRPRNFQRLSVNFTRTIVISSDVKVTFLEEQWVGEREDTQTYKIAALMSHLARRTKTYCLQKIHFGKTNVLWQKGYFKEVTFQTLIFANKKTWYETAVVLSFKDWMNLRILACTLFFVFVLLCFLLSFFFFCWKQIGRGCFLQRMSWVPPPTPLHVIVSFSLLRMVKSPNNLIQKIQRTLRNSDLIQHET